MTSPDIAATIVVSVVVICVAAVMITAILKGWR